MSPYRIAPRPPSPPKRASPIERVIVVAMSCLGVWFIFKLIDPLLESKPKFGGFERPAVHIGYDRPAHHSGRH